MEEFSDQETKWKRLDKSFTALYRYKWPHLQ